MTVPRLELLAACLGVQAVRRVKDVFQSSKDFNLVTYWLDAKSVLALIRNKDARFPVLVANRLSEIHDFTTAHQWKYCPTELNPDDHGSRMVMPSQLDSLRAWIDGPEYLKKGKDEWPEQDVNLTICVVSASLTVQTKSDSFEKFFERCSSLIKLKRAIVYLTRFKQYLRNKTKRINSPPLDLFDVSLRKHPVSVLELESATFDLCRIVQMQVFPETLKHLSSLRSKQAKLSTRDEMNSIRSLSPYVDSAGLLRVGGRLQQSNLLDDCKLPIILPKRHHLTK